MTVDELLERAESHVTQPPLETIPAVNRLQQYVRRPYAEDPNTAEPALVRSDRLSRTSRPDPRGKAANLQWGATIADRQVEQALDAQIDEMNLTVPTPNRRNERNSSDRHPTPKSWRTVAAEAAREGVEVECEGEWDDIEEANEAMRILGGRLEVHFAPHWKPVKLDPPKRVAWLPERSDYISPKERQLARIVHHLHQGLNCEEIARKMSIPLRTVQRRVEYLLSFEHDVD